MADRFWGKGEGLQESHFLDILEDGQGSPICYPDHRVTNIVKGKRKPICDSCVQLVKLRSEPRTKSNKK